MSMTIYDRYCHGNAEPEYAVSQMAKPRQRTKETAKFNTFGRRLVSWRGRIALRTASERSGIAESTLRLWEGGHVASPDPLGLVSLARVYDVALDEVFGALADSRGVKLPSIPPRSRPTNVAGFTSVPLLEDEIAAGPPLIINESRIAGEMVFPQRSLDNLGIGKPVCVVVGRRERSMLPTIEPGNVVLLDCSNERRSEPRKDRIYAVNVEEGATLKRIVREPGFVMLVADNPDKDNYETQRIPVDDDESIMRLVVGQVMWWGDQL